MKEQLSDSNPAFMVLFGLIVAVVIMLFTLVAVESNSDLTLGLQLMLKNAAHAAGALGIVIAVAGLAHSALISGGSERRFLRFLALGLASVAILSDHWGGAVGLAAFAAVFVWRGHGSETASDESGA